MKNPLPMALALLLTAPFAQAEIVDIKWSDTGRFQHTSELAPGKFAELCGPLRQGQSVKWSFGADIPLNFNVHYHVGKDVKFPAKQDQVSSQDGELQVTSAQDYCWMWTNKSATAARLTVTLLKY